MYSPITRVHTAAVSSSAKPSSTSRKCIPDLVMMELNVNRNNKALQFYEHMGMRKLREGDFPIGNGYYMNDYIMGLDI